MPRIVSNQGVLVFHRQFPCLVVKVVVVFKRACVGFDDGGGGVGVVIMAVVTMVW